jgi:hypothetical protein
MAAFHSIIYGRFWVITKDRNFQDYEEIGNVSQRG